MSASNAFFSKIKSNGKEESVMINQSALIKKMLGRYSSDFVVFRELIQNSDDAQAKSFQLQFICDSPTDLETDNHQRHGLFSSIGKFFRNHFQNNDQSSDDDDDQNDESLMNIERKFHNKIIKEIRTVNDGVIFTDEDWKRVATIAEGNTNVDAIGQFGVGFFTVFSYSDKPMIKSGKYGLAFDWKTDKSLTTFRYKLPNEEQSTTTSIILIMRDKYIFDSKSNNDQSTIPKINLTQLKFYFLKVLSFTKHINELTITIDGETIFKVKKSQKPISSPQTSLTCKNSHLLNTEIFQLKSFLHTEQMYKITYGPSMTLNSIHVEMSVHIDKELHNQIRNIIQKNLPSTIHIKLLFPTKNSLELLTSTDSNPYTRSLQSLIPLKFEKDKMIPSGQIFIGLSTHQSTGVGIHVHSHFIPTVERENLDFQNPYIEQWNRQILKSIGKIIRLIYDQIILDQTQDYNSLFTIYSFLSTIPNTDIGHWICEEFFSKKTYPLIPVKQTPSDEKFTLVSSRDAFITDSEKICLFLSKNLVPYYLTKNHFFTILQKYQLINVIDYSQLIDDIHQTIFLLNEFIELLHWLCTKEINKKNYIQQVLANIHFRQTINSNIITLKNVQYYDKFQLSSDLPIPSNVLPSYIACHLSNEQLNKNLYLTEVPLEYILSFYITQKEQQELFCHEKTSGYLLIFISQNWNQLKETIHDQIKTFLSKLKCIPTTKGMRLPKDAYIYSENLSQKTLPVITLPILNLTKTNHENNMSNEQLKNTVSIDFLKEIGCRTIYISSDTSIESSSNAEYNREYIQKFLKQRKNMTEADLDALKQTKNLIGTKLGTNNMETGKYLPKDLHFPSVATELKWPSLLVLDWSDIMPYSQEYLFLKDLGVKEIVDLDKLLSRIIEEHQQSPSLIIKDYKLPIALTFLVNNFHKYYIKLWNPDKSQQVFLPCYFSTKMFDPNDNLNESKVLLEAPKNIFTDASPLFPTPIPAVIDLFKSQLDISLIGVKKAPNLDFAFKMLMTIKNDILTVQTAPKLFGYLSRLDGLNKDLINFISQYAFIPLPDQNKSVKPNEVFIRSNRTSSLNNNSFLHETNTSGLIDYIDYGSDANFFLEKIGVLRYPTAEVLATLLLDRQATYFSDKNNHQLEIKLRVYTNCLKQLAAYSIYTHQLNIEPVRTRLLNEPWCLGYQIDASQDNGNKSSISKIVKPSEIYLNDDEQYLHKLKPLCAPEEPELVKLYEQFGAKWLSESVKRTLSHIGDVTVTERSNQLLNLIQHRLDLLFVNKRGEKLSNVSTKRTEMLRQNLFVYETDDIECQLTLDNKTIVLRSTQCSSCVLKSESTQVNIYIRKNLANLEYFDIATELARFTFKKPKEDIVDAISNKLSSSLEVLRRRGIPIDRLLKVNNIQPSAKKHQQNPPEQKTNGTVKTSNQQFLNINQNDQPTKSPRGSRRVSDFGKNKSKASDLISTVIRGGQAFTSSNLNDAGYVSNEPLSECESMPTMDMTKYKDLFCLIPLFLEKNVRVTEQIIYQAEQLACLVVGLANHVFEIPFSTMHLFRDMDGDKIAFNKNGSLFFNLRYFEQTFSEELGPAYTTPSARILTKLVNFYFVVTCHELTHNKHSKHSLNFLEDMQMIIVEFLPKKDLFLKKFTFTTYF